MSVTLKNSEGPLRVYAGPVSGNHGARSRTETEGYREFGLLSETLRILSTDHITPRTSSLSSHEFGVDFLQFPLSWSFPPDLSLSSLSTSSSVEILVIDVLFP